MDVSEPISNADQSRDIAEICLEVREKAPREHLAVTFIEFIGSREQGAAEELHHPLVIGIGDFIRGPHCSRFQKTLKGVNKRQKGMSMASLPPQLEHMRYKELFCVP